MFRHAFREYDEAAHAAMCEHRELYFAQSAATRNGVVATLPVARSRSLVPLNAGPSAVPSPSPKADGSAPFTHGANA